MQNYADFDSVDVRISPEQSRTLRQRRERRQQPFSLDAIVPFRAQTINDNVVMIGESVEQQFRTSTQTFYDYYGRVVPFTSTVFDGYGFNDAFIWLLDSNGKPRKNYISDISMALNSSRLVNRVAFYPDPSETTILFANATNIFYKSLDPYEVSYRTLRLQQLYRNDRVVEDHDSRIIHWYGSNFLVVGYQTIQNNTLRGANRRIVFYLSKLSLD